MTEQRRRQIRAELARRMGWTVKKFKHSFELCRPGGTFLQSPFGDGYPASFTLESDAWQYAPDPSTNAADKDALVKWLAADDSRWRSFFRHFSEALELDFDVEYPVYCAMLMMTASYETITLAAARALGIGEAE